jgi:hypothetical protein
VRRRLYIYLDLHDCEGNTQDYVHTVTIEYAPFPAIVPTSDVVDCYANIVLPAPPVSYDNCGVTLTPTGPVETGSVAVRRRLYIYLDYTDCEGNSAGLCSYGHDRVCPIPAIRSDIGCS